MAFESLVLGSGKVLVPRPVTASAQWLVELETPAGQRLARCHSWVAGTPASAPLPLPLLQTAGAYLGFMHAMDQPGGDTAQLPVFDVDRWERAVRAAARSRIEWAGLLADLTPLVEDLNADVDPVRAQRRPMRVSHRDYDPRNAVVDQADRLVITDWDHAGPVLPGVELVTAATSFGTNDAEVAAFVHSYREAGGNATAADPLAMAVEAVDLDWLLRNVEACLDSDPATCSVEHHTARTLIETFPGAVEALRSWPARLSAASS